MGGISLIVTAFAAIAVVIGVPMLRPRPRAVVVEPRRAAVLNALPGGNCGACGNDSCFDAADAVATGRASASVCVAGGLRTAAAVTEALRSCDIGPRA